MSETFFIEQDIDKLGRKINKISNQKNTIVGFGDSLIMGQSDLPYPATHMYVNYTGYIHIANTTLNQRMNLLGLFGHGGYTTQMIIDGGYINDVIAVKPTYCVFSLGTNDIITGASSSITIANLKTLYSNLLNKGIKIIASTLPPYDSATTQQKQARAKINNFIKNFAFITPNVYLLDSASVTSQPNGDVYITGYSGDGIHPGANGSYKIGTLLADLLSKFVPDFNKFICSNNDPSNLLGNALFTSGTGTASGWAHTPGTGGVASLVARTDGQIGAWQQLTQTGGTTYFNWASAITTGFTIGDTVSATIEFEFDVATTSGGIDLKVTLEPSFNTLWHQYKGFTTFDGKRGVLKVPNFVIEEGMSSLGFQIQVTGNCTVRLARPKFEVIASL